MACPFLALRFGGIVNTRLRTLATNLFEIAHRQNDAWRATHITGVTRRQAIFKPGRSVGILNELAL
jgi:hypothetical protein